MSPLPRAAAFLLCALLCGAAQARWHGPDRKEQELLKALKQEKLIRARELAEEILRARPQAIIARYVLARVFHDEEANLPRALFHARQAEARLVRSFGAAPTDEEARRWHQRILEEQITILGEMDQRTEQLRAMDRHDALYKPSMDRWRIWPLMKLHRFEQALALARTAAGSEDLQLRISGLNGLIAIESERNQPDRCFRQGMEAVVATGYQSCILNQNTAEAAFAVYKFDEAERLALRSVQATMQDCPASAYAHLANLYLLRGDFQRAMDAVKSSRTQKIERRYRQQFEMSHAAWLARLLFALGQFPEAHDLAQRVLRAPDRVGMTSFSDEVMRVIYTLDHHATLAALVEHKREQASARPLGREHLRIWLDVVELQREAWSTRRRLARLLGEDGSLPLLMRPYLKPLPPWLAGELIAAAGGGVVLEALDRARARETLRAGTEPYFAALEGEVRYRQGEYAQALQLSRRALAGLPRAETLLRGRTAAWAAAAALRSGQAQQARDHFHTVLARFPTALRILGIPLPARIRADAAPLSRAVAARLSSSRRLVPGDLGFEVRVTTAGGEVKVCLSGAGGRRYACATPAPPDEGRRAAGGPRPPGGAAGRPGAPRGDLDAQVAAAVDAFHQKAFAPKIDLTQRDINSLDGSAVRGDADEVLREVLGP